MSSKLSHAEYATFIVCGHNEYLGGCFLPVQVIRVLCEKLRKYKVTQRLCIHMLFMNAKVTVVIYDMQSGGNKLFCLQGSRTILYNS